MKNIAALFIMCLTTTISFAANDATDLKLEKGKFVIAQSYCRMCADSATACRIKCNGSGTCIQACDDALRDCIDLNCRRR
jgi:hypothetical protein